jgi:hypothetical protein
VVSVDDGRHRKNDTVRIIDDRIDRAVLNDRQVSLEVTVRLKCQRNALTKLSLQSDFRRDESVPTYATTIAQMDYRPQKLYGTGFCALISCFRLFLSGVFFYDQPQDDIKEYLILMRQY